MIKNKKNGKIYIGQTIRSIERRLKEHQDKKSGCVAIYRAIQKHGWDAFETDWYECPDEDLNFDEELLVREMGTLAPDGYNLREGGGNRGKHSEESKQKNRDAHLGEKHNFFGKKHTKKTIQKMSEAKLGEKHNFFGKKHTEETKQKQREALQGEKNHMYGKTPSEETKQKQREALQGEKHPSSKTVYQYDMENTLVRTFASTREAARHLGKKHGNAHISLCARGLSAYDYIYGFKWSYHDNEANKFAAR